VSKLFVIGIGYRPLDPQAQDILLKSALILASRRLLEIFGKYAEYEEVKDRIRVINNVEETLAVIRTHLKDDFPISLLASGDPLFFGIGRQAVQEFGADRVEIFPDLSSIQLAFARIREPWDNAFLMSLHGGPDPGKKRRTEYGINDIPGILERHGKIAILTDKENNPSRIASLLEASPAAASTSLFFHVCEKLGYPDEKIISGTPAEISRMSFADPNVIIIRKQGRPDSPLPCVRFGITEREITHSRGLITKDEIRAVTIHKLRCPRSGVFWDIGAGSGSVSLEVAGICPDMKIYAVEKDSDQVRNMSANTERFCAANIEIVAGEAPEALRGLAAPDRVFIGGSGGRLSEIIGLISGTMGSGILVVNAATLETLNEAMKSLTRNGFETDISEVSVFRSKRVGNKRHMYALNPVFIIKGEKA
jgi:precorrin-6B C5,15-methyltransferase / cobalt-precorrin-6B C5,C15-methyltransferase